MSNYVIRPNDSLWSISKQFGVTTEQLRAANPGLERRDRHGRKVIYPNTTIVIPDSLQRVSTAPGDISRALGIDPSSSKTRALIEPPSLRALRSIPVPTPRPVRCVKGEPLPIPKRTSAAVPGAQPVSRTRSAGPGAPISAARLAEYREIGAWIQSAYPDPEPARWTVRRNKRGKRVRVQQSEARNMPPISVYRQLAAMASADTGVPARTILAALSHESSGDWNARSSARSPARGVMQLKDVAWLDVRQNRRDLAGVSYEGNHDNPGLNMLFGAQYWKIRGGAQGYYSGTRAQNISYERGHMRALARLERS